MDLTIRDVAAIVFIVFVAGFACGAYAVIVYAQAGVLCCS